MAMKKEHSPVHATEQPSDGLETWQWEDVVWSNVVKLGLLHIFAIWGIFVWAELKWQTHIFGEYPIFFFFSDLLIYFPFLHRSILTPGSRGVSPRVNDSQKSRIER